MKCPRCGNEDSSYFVTVRGRTYCRACIKFGRIYTDEKIEKRIIVNKLEEVTYHLSFTLSPRQNEISLQLIECFKNKWNALVLAVCGSGKTEVSFGVIAYALSKGKRVCFCVPRKALCIELYHRFKEHFEGIEIGLIYGGVCECEQASFIVCTTHQLYRFVKTPFHLILLDEADAFPFYGNQVLESLFNKCNGGIFIKMSATLTSEDIHDEKLFIMNRRYHGHKLPVPRCCIMPTFCWNLFLLYMLRKYVKKHPVLIYVPTRKSVMKYVSFLSHFYLVRGVCALSSDINEKLSLLKNRKIDLLVTTTILERGITIEDVYCIVINAAAAIYDERTLMQIAGRVGRKPGYEEGDVLFIDRVKSKEMKVCIKTIEKLNRMSV